MLCRTCGTEIADKAIVCFRCGAPTAARRPATGTSRRGRGVLLAAAAVVLLVAVGLLLGPRVPAGAPRWLLYGGLAVAGIAIARLAIKTRGR
jgi:hypothetical protein